MDRRLQIWKNSLRCYQTRKGFPVTGKIDDPTAASLQVKLPAGAAASASPLPDVPVLKSDLAPQLAAEDRIAREQAAEKDPDAVPIPSAPAESPSSAQDLNPARVTGLVEEYLRDAETTDIAAQTHYFSYPVNDFDHGSRGAAFVTRDVRDYVKRWPNRKYTLLGPVTFIASANEEETIIEFPITYEVRRGKFFAKGKTRNTWLVRPEGGELKIRAIQEERYANKLTSSQSRAVPSGAAWLLLISTQA